MATAFAVGLTITVAVVPVPGQLLAVVVMVNVTVIAALVELISVPLIFPDPLFPIVPVTPGLSLVQLKVVPLTVPLSTMGVIADPEQIVCDDGAAVAFGVGFTKTVAVIGVPLQVTPAFV